jgi:hypothetical protein
MSVEANAEGSTVHDEDSATPEEEVLAAYEWSAGTCFRCGRVDCQVAPVGFMEQAAGRVPVMACKWCVLRMERQREAAAERYG